MLFYQLLLERHSILFWSIWLWRTLTTRPRVGDIFISTSRYPSPPTHTQPILFNGYKVLLCILVLISLELEQKLNTLDQELDQIFNPKITISSCYCNTPIVSSSGSSPGESDAHHIIRISRYNILHNTARSKCREEKCVSLLYEVRSNL